MAENSRPLIRLATNSEDAASGLVVYKDVLPFYATRITAIIAELYAVNSVLRELDNAQIDPGYGRDWYRIEGHVDLIVLSFQYTLDDVFGMFRKARGRSQQAAWDDLERKMSRDEAVDFLERLQWYHAFLEYTNSSLDGNVDSRIDLLRRRIDVLLDAQEMSRKPGLRDGANERASNTPRPLPTRGISYRIVEAPMSPTSSSEAWSYFDRAGPPPPAPEPEPLSPTFTSSSSQTLDSSHTSYSSYGFAPPPVAPPVHWAAEVFDGQNPRTAFRRSHQSDDPTKCYGTSNPDAIHRLREDGFNEAVQVSFDRGQVSVSLYCRPHDLRARILFATKDHRNRDLHYCVPLTQLIAIRNKTCLRLCQARKRDGSYKPWADLNFMFYERMVLFYCTFVAMKRQDAREPLQPALIENLNLREEQLFGGVVMDGRMQHALRLFVDHGSGVVRLEACPLRGAMEDVPLWTAFVTRYANDPDWMALENGGIVTLAALRPPPYTFLVGYRLPTRKHGEYVLQFKDVSDAKDFVQSWNGLCRSSRR